MSTHIVACLLLYRHRQVSQAFHVPLNTTPSASLFIIPLIFFLPFVLLLSIILSYAKVIQMSHSSA